MHVASSGREGLTPGELLLLRGSVVAGLALALLLEAQFLARSPVAEMLVWVTGLLAVFDLALHWRQHSAPLLAPREVQGQLLVDVAVLTFFFYFTGGASHPFVDLFLLPVAIAAASLPWRHTLLVSLLTLACYLMLVKFHMPLPEARAGVSGFQCVAMWLKYALVAAVTIYLLYGAASRLRERERGLARAARRNLQEDFLARAGMLAAGAAHEMSGPLCTLSVLVNELAQAPANEATAKNLRLVAGQIDHCRRALAQLMTYGQGVLAEGAAAEPADRFVQELIARWRAMRPGVAFTCQRSGTQPAPDVPADRGLGHALLNLLNNAADASPRGVEMSCTWCPAELRVTIADRGPGFPAGVLEALGERCLSSKGDRGLGVGLLMAKTLIESAGGRLRLAARPGGGAQAEVVLPLAPSAAPGTTRPPDATRYLVRYYQQP